MYFFLLKKDILFYNSIKMTNYMFIIMYHTNDPKYYGLVFNGILFIYLRNMYN